MHSGLHVFCPSSFSKGIRCHGMSAFHVTPGYFREHQEDRQNEVHFYPGSLSELLKMRSPQVAKWGWAPSGLPAWEPCGDPGEVGRRLPPFAYALPTKARRDECISKNDSLIPFGGQYQEEAFSALPTRGSVRMCTLTTPVASLLIIRWC